MTSEVEGQPFTPASCCVKTVSWMEPHLVAELEEHYDRFIERVLSGGHVWTLKCDDGLLTCLADNGEQAVIPFWSDAAYAQRAAKDVPPDGYAVDSVPLRTFLKELLGNFQRDDVLIGPNHTRDMAGLELDPRDVFEEFRSRMSDEQRGEYRECLEAASILVVGHPPEKLSRRVGSFARIASAENVAWTLVRDDGPVQIDIHTRPGASFVPLWSSGAQAARARRFAFGPDRGVRVSKVQLDEFLSEAENHGRSIGVEPTVGLACVDVRPRDLMNRVKQAEDELEEEEPSSTP